MLEAALIIVALGGLEIVFWWAEHRRQANQVKRQEAIWVELALLYKAKTWRHSGYPRQGSVGMPIAVRATAVTR